VDDVNICNSDWNEHLEHLKLVYEKLRFVKLKLNLGKYYYGVREIVFLGHVVNEQGSRLNPTNLNGHNVMEWQRG